TQTGWVEGPSHVREAVVSYFRGHFANEEWQRPTLDGIEFPRLSQENVDSLTAIFTLEETSKVVKGCDGSKSPGMVAKVLAARLAKVVGDLIPKTQSAFLKGRKLVEGVVVVNEVIDFAKKTGRECLIFKVDFEKAYDSVDWGFLDYMLQRFGFDMKWRAWMKACVCSESMSVLVNGSPTEEICIKRGLKQGDPLDPLLFLIVAEGLGALMRMVVENGRFKPFLVGRGSMHVSILQYADDTLCIGEATVENLWTLKVVLKGFELVSGIGRTPFNYLGLPVGANPHRYSTWVPMLEAIRRRLGAWGNKYISLGGRIVLINAVLSSIPIFFLSYLKMPVKVWKEMVSVQRNFLWGGLSKRRQISWVKWADICKPKKEGGLGIRDLRLVNLSLLAKWRWKLLMEGDEVWKNVMVAKYGEGVLGKVRLDDMQIGTVCSLWWRDLCQLEKGGEWFSQVAVKKMGGGNSIKFWKDVWVRDQTLELRFPRLFGVSVQQDNVVREVGRWVDARVITDVEDRWVWKPNEAEGFSVKSMYVVLEGVLLPQSLLNDFESVVLKNIWKSAVPSKVCALAWQLCLDRIPTKENLCRRRIVRNDDSLCSLWLGTMVVLPPDVMMSYGQLVGCGGNKKIRKGFSIVWLAFVWVIWRVRNDRVFNNVNGAVEETVDKIQRMSWQWYLNKTTKGSSLLYEWVWNPGDCMLR
ncbi:LINE-1 reverse transcriptase like, partial [Trifolium medium]|nr:LINE-1 reverse transcriptase like [Trifolium medium]